MKGPAVLLVHCVDTEGPIGGDVRRRPDGTAEFLATWGQIKESFREITNYSFRQAWSDSWARPYNYNWFIMDFTGFRTNPKKRMARYHDTYDNIKSPDTAQDGIYWHYHHPPADGQGDRWSSHWESSHEYWNILLHRLVEREDWPEVFRAGGTIEDEACSQWLEKYMLVDYSNRVSHRSAPGAELADFNWYGAPERWGYYHPAHGSVTIPGGMERYIVRSVDLWSRFHVLERWEVENAFQQAVDEGRPVILSYFSHDHRDMRDETIHGLRLVTDVAKKTGVPWRSCQALEALQLAADINKQKVSVSITVEGDGLRLVLDRDIYQPQPMIGAQMVDGSLRWLVTCRVGEREYEVSLLPGMKKIVVGGTAVSGDKFVQALGMGILRTAQRVKMEVTV